MAKNMFNMANRSLSFQDQEDQQTNPFSTWAQQQNTPQINTDWNTWRGTGQNNPMGSAGSVQSAQPSHARAVYGGPVNSLTPTSGTNPMGYMSGQTQQMDAGLADYRGYQTQGNNGMVGAASVNPMTYMPTATPSPGVSDTALLGGWQGDYSGANIPGGLDPIPYFLINGGTKQSKYLDKGYRDSMNAMLEKLMDLGTFNANLQSNQANQYINLKNLEESQRNNAYQREQSNFQNALNEALRSDANKQFADQLGLDTRVAEQRYGQQGIERYNIDQTTARNAANLQNQIDLQNLINSGALGQIQEQGAQDTSLQTLRGTQEDRLQRLIGQQEMQRLMEQNQSQELQSRYNTFGRSQAPNVRARANWG